MMIYTRVKTKYKKKKKNSVLAKRFDVNEFRNSIKHRNYVPGYNFSIENEKIPSRVTQTKFVPARTGVMDPVNLMSEPEHIRNEIIAKSKRLAPAYNKGAIQYITDGEDLTTFSRKIK